MKTIFLFIYIYLLSFTLPVYSQIGFQRAIGGTGDDYGESVIQTSDGGFAIIGYSNSFGSSFDVYVLKLSDSGTIQWSRTIGGTSTDYGYSIVQTSDNGYAILGYTNSFGQGNSDFYAVRLTNTGGIKWNRTLGQQGSDQAFSIISTTDGGFLFGGYTPSGGAGSADCNFVKVDSNCSVLWTRDVGGSGYDRINSVIQTMDGGFAGCGYTNSIGGGGYDVYVIKLNAFGFLQWSKTVGGSGNDYGYSIVEDADSSLVIAGSTTSFGAGAEDFYILKIDKVGQLVWTRTVGGSSSDLAYSVTKTIDGGFAIGGSTNSFGAGSSDFYLVRLDNNGALQWSKTVGGSNSEMAYCIRQTVGGSLIMVGNTQSYGSGSNDIYLVKFDSNGNTCGSTSSPSSTTNSGGTLSSGGIYGLSSPVVGSPSYSTGTGGNVISICNLVNVTSQNEELPETFELLQNYPNPFNPLTTIKFKIPKEAFVSITVFDIAGREISTVFKRNLNAGWHEVIFDGSDYASGIYMYKIETSTFIDTKKMVLIK